MDKKISIIIPHYGGTDILKLLLNSIVAQNYNDYEIIVINNNLEKIDNKIFMFDEFRIINLESNRGYSYSCNLGAKIAKFNNLFFLSNDCVLENKNFLIKLSKNISKLKNNTIIGPRIFFRNKDIYKEGFLTIDLFSSLRPIS